MVQLDGWGHRHLGAVQRDVLGPAHPRELREQSEGEGTSEVGEQRWRTVITTEGGAFVAQQTEPSEDRLLLLASQHLRLHLEAEARLSGDRLGLERRLSHRSPPPVSSCSPAVVASAM